MSFTYIWHIAPAEHFMCFANMCNTTAAAYQPSIVHNVPEPFHCIPIALTNAKNPSTFATITTNNLGRLAPEQQFIDFFINFTSIVHKTTFQYINF